MTSPRATRQYSVSVRDLVEFVLRTGNLGGNRDFVSSTRAREGTRGHQRLQKSRPAEYQKEVSLSLAIERSGFRLLVRGRIDGLIRRETSVWMEEIKTVLSSWDGVPDPLHWAQLKFYAFIFLQQNPAEAADAQLAYLDLENEQVAEFRNRWPATDLAAFGEKVLDEYLEWIQADVEWKLRRDESIAALNFPFGAYRPGQRKMAVAVFKAISAKQTLLAEAPTGIGKTISALFPAIKAARETGAGTIFYLTAKTSGRMAAEKAVADLRAAGLRFRGVTLTAKDKICFNNGQPCDQTLCPYAIGYFDRVKTALREALSEEFLTRAALEAVARRHQVCPFELSLDAAAWSDLVMGDYNYVYDPSVSLKRFFGEDGGDYVFLADEAHNLADRAREMFSAEIESASLKGLAPALRDEAPACAKALRKLARVLGALTLGGEEQASANIQVSREFPAEILPPIKDLLKKAEAWLAQNQPADFREPLLQLYFQLTGFLRVAESYDENYASILERGDFAGLRLFCLDPSSRLSEIGEQARSSIFFSATLSPQEFFRDLFGKRETDSLLRLPSPFPPENLLVLLARRISTTYRARESSYGRVAEAIAALVEQKTGNYLAYFPSYQYLSDVLSRFRLLRPDIAVLAQTPGMTEAEREQFIAAFRAEPEQTLAGFAVMGGVFGEGIDLVGERLVGAAIVSVGLPQIGVERDLIRSHFQERNGMGFEYAYMFPGLNKALQAAGRVIRSETDRGIILLIDARFAQPAYADVLPQWWAPRMVDDASQIAEQARRFWDVSLTQKP